MLIKQNTLRWKTLSIIFALCASSTSLFVYWYHPALLDQLDERSRDVVFSFRDTPSPPKEIVIIAIDEKSIKEQGRWPWPRSVQAALIKKIKQFDVGVIALDIVYLVADSPHEDKFLVEALRTPGSPVIGGYFFRDEQTFPPDAQSLDILLNNQVSLVQQSAHFIESIPYFDYVELSKASFSKHMHGQGFFNFIPEPDGLFRYSPTIIDYKQNYYPSLPILALAKFMEETIELKFSDEGLTKLSIGSIDIPIDRAGRLALNYYSLKNSIKIISAIDVLSNKISPLQIKDKLVFVGVTELGVADVRPTPLDPVYPGVALHATVAANILQNYYLISDGQTVLINVALISLLPFLLVFSVARLQKPLLQSFVVFFTIFTLWSFFYWMVAHKGILVSFAYPLIAAFLGFLFYQAYYILVSQRYTRFLKNAFANYVSSNLVEQLIKNPEQLTLTGEKKDISVLFSDIRNFTTLSETLDPNDLVSLVNRYFEPMTDTIMFHQGTLDKYIGDAIMALYNAPIDLPRHPELAVKSALEMMRKLKKLNTEFKIQYNIELTIGIGINTGSAVVGNMGSRKRFDYTAMGDAVNLAARLESITKLYGVSIIISKTTFEQISDTILCRKLDRIKVKGKNIPVTIYEVILATDSANKLFITEFETALEYYFNANFNSAKKIFQALYAQTPQDVPTKIFLDRCIAFSTNAPADDWAGVYISADK